MNGYIALGYGVTIVTLALYTLRVAVRTRALTRAVTSAAAPAASAADAVPPVS
jgi:hypothetical protein